MIHRTNRSPLTAWLAVAALCLLLAAPATPANPATAAPADTGPSGSFLAWVADWWSGLADGWMALTAGSEVAPDADPDGFSTEPLPDGELSTTQTPEGDGEVYPDADPDG